MDARQNWAGIAGRAFDWIGSVAVDVDGGLAWRDGGILGDGLYAGTAGVLVGCAEAAAAGLGAAPVSAGARARLLQLADAGQRPGVTTLTDDGLFTGWAGVAVALRAWSRGAADAAAASAARQVTSQIAGRIEQASDSRPGCTDVISGDAGILLALTADEPAVQAAHILADRLVAAAESTPDGLHWRMEAGREYLLPGFSHGTAGVAYALARAGLALNRSDLVDVAVHGACALLALGHHPGGWAVPHAVPPRPQSPAVAYGWCHGPAGTVRLFLLLNQIDPQPRWQHAIDACLQALRDSRLPSRLYPGYWDNLARCCGTAGVGQLLLDCYQATGDTVLLDWAGTLAADVADRALLTPLGVTWSNTEHTRTPPELPPEPGFMQGAAGIAGWLARLHALRTRPGTTPFRPGPSWL